MKKLVIAGTLFLVVGISTGLAQIGNEQLTSINGSWSGSLTYTDYGDDSSQVQLLTKMTARWKSGKGVLKFYYTEPNGKVIKGSQKLRLGETASEFYIGDLWSVTGFITKDSNNWTLTLEKEGRDNNRDASMRQIVELSDTRFRITKQVRYEGTKEFFQRNEYSFTRE